MVEVRIPIGMPEWLQRVFGSFDLAVICGAFESANFFQVKFVPHLLTA